jgi:hypothetical protein
MLKRWSSSDAKDDTEDLLVVVGEATWLLLVFVPGRTFVLIVPIGRIGLCAACCMLI